MIPRFPIADLSAQEAAVRHQRRMSTITSVVVALLVIALLLLVFAFIFLPALFKESPVVVAYSAPPTQEDKIDPKKTFAQVQRKPSAPSSATAKVIAANTVSPTAVPVPETEVVEPSDVFGSGDDFGDGWGSGSGDGLGGGGANFFNQKVVAQRICYVIDYSGSMRGTREKLMREELAKSVEGLGVGMQFQMIYFAGPTWVAGNEVTMAKNKKTAEVVAGRDEFKWKSSGGAFRWEPSGKKQVPEWLAVSPSERREALELIQETKLVWGTNWENPLEMALRMDPLPQVIFFMTDGSAGKDSLEVAKKQGHRAKSKGIIINTVALMEPNAEAGMKELAKRTGGQFTVVEKGGKVKKVPLK